MQGQLFSDLKPCPWCGEPPVSLVGGRRVGAYAWKRPASATDAGKWTGEVSHYCPAVVGVHVEVIATRESKAEAIEAAKEKWNARRVDE